MENGQWTMENGPLGPKGRLRREAEQEWTMDNGQWIMDNGPLGRARRVARGGASLRSAHRAGGKR